MWKCIFEIDLSQTGINPTACVWNCLDSMGVICNCGVLVVICSQLLL